MSQKASGTDFDGITLVDVWLVGARYADLGFEKFVVRGESISSTERTLLEKANEEDPEATVNSLVDVYSSGSRRLMFRHRLRVEPLAQPSCVLELDCVAEFQLSAKSMPHSLGEMADLVQHIAGPVLMVFAKEKAAELTHSTPYPTIHLPSLKFELEEADSPKLPKAKQVRLRTKRKKQRS